MVPQKSSRVCDWYTFASWSHNKWLVQKLDPLLLMLLLQMRHELLSKQVRNLIALGITNTFMPRCHHVENGEFRRFFRSGLSPTLWFRQAAGHHDIKNTTPFWNARSPRSYWYLLIIRLQFCTVLLREVFQEPEIFMRFLPGASTIPRENQRNDRLDPSQVAQNRRDRLSPHP